jgi:ParB-like chromosome segregation protein Spo0J
MNQNLEVAYIATTDIIPYANNPRTHSDQQVAQVAASIKEFGFNNPILLDEHNGIIAGHGRLAAAQKLGMSLVPTITLEGLTEAQRKAYIIADNKIALNSGWDDELLRIELEILSDSGLNLDVLGWEVLPEFAEEVSYDVLDDDDVAEQLEDMTSNVRKAIQIDFDLEHYEEAQELIKFWRSQGAYVGGLVMNLLKQEKSKL